MKKIRMLMLCFGLLFLAAGCGKKEDTKWIEESAALIGTEITDGQFVLDGVVYTFPMALQDWLDNGWHISNNYENKDEFILEADSTSTEFELFNEAGDYIRVSVMNTTDEGIKIEQGMVYTLYMSTTEVDVVFPQGMTKRNKPAEVLEAYGEPDNKDASGESLDASYFFESDEEYQCYVELGMIDNSYTIDPFTSVHYAVLGFEQFWDAWVESEGKEKAVENYFDITMKTCFHGKLDEMVDCSLDTREGAAQLYEYEMSTYASALVYYLGLDPSYLDEASMNRFTEVAKQVLSKVNWKVIGVELGKFNDATMKIDLYPTDFLYLIDEEYVSVLEGVYAKYENADIEAMSDEEYAIFEKDYMNAMLELMETKAATAGTLEPVTVDVAIDLDEVFISDEDWLMIDYTIMDIYSEE